MSYVTIKYDITYIYVIFDGDILHMYTNMGVKSSDLQLQKCQKLQEIYLKTQSGEAQSNFSGKCPVFLTFLEHFRRNSKTRNFSQMFITFCQIDEKK